jgi:hypothetical protein
MDTKFAADKLVDALVNMRALEELLSAVLASEPV